MDELRTERITEENRIYDLLMKFKPMFPLWDVQVADFHEWSKKLAQYSNFICLKQEDELIGIVVYYANDKKNSIGYVTILGILPEYQRRRYGAYLFQYALDDMLKNKMKTVKLQVDVGNTAIYFYRYFGFDQVCVEGQSILMSRVLSTGGRVKELNVSDGQKSGIKALIKAALTGQKDELPGGFTIDDAYPIMKAHCVCAMALDGALQYGFDAESTGMKALKQNVDIEKKHYMKLVYIATRIFAVLKQQGIPYMPLKGYFLKSLYPKSAYRMMTDVDIIVKNEDYPKVRKVLMALGCQEGLITDYEYHWDYMGATVEFHSHLVSPASLDFANYYDDAWKFAKVDAGNGMFRMTNEDMLVYQVMHFAKHYREKGIGLRQLVDFYVIRKNTENLNTEYVFSELQKMHLDVFYRNICDTIDAWFEGTEHTEASDKIEETVFTSGVFGNRENLGISFQTRKLNDGYEEQSKKKRIVKLLFPSRESLVSKYPVLWDHPALLPLIWLIRLFSGFCKKIKRIISGEKSITKKADVSEHDIKKYKEELNLVGLNFNY